MSNNPEKKSKVDSIVKYILELPGVFGLLISIFFIILSIRIIIFFLNSFVLQMINTTSNINNFFLELIILAKLLLTSLLFVVISYGIIRIIFKAKVYKYDVKYLEEFRNKWKNEERINNSEKIIDKLSLNGILPFENIDSIEQLERYIFGILIFQFLIVLTESFLKDDYLLLISKGITTSLIIIVLSIYMYLSSKVA